MPKIREIAAAVREAIAAHPKKLPLNALGQLVPDPTPMAPPIGYRPQPSIADMIRQQVLAISRDAAREGNESLEEADDFEVGDDPEISSPYELDLESEVPIRVLEARAELARNNYLEAKREAGLRMTDDAAHTPKPADPPAKPEQPPKPPEGAK